MARGVVVVVAYVDANSPNLLNENVFIHETPSQVTRSALSQSLALNPNGGDIGGRRW